MREDEYENRKQLGYFFLQICVHWHGSISLKSLPTIIILRHQFMSQGTTQLSTRELYLHWYAQKLMPHYTRLLKIIQCISDLCYACFLPSFYYSLLKPLCPATCSPFVVDTPASTARYQWLDCQI